MQNSRSLESLEFAELRPSNLFKISLNINNLIFLSIDISYLLTSCIYVSLEKRALDENTFAYDY